MNIEEAISVAAFNLVGKHDAHLVDDGPDVQAARVRQQLRKLHQITPLSVPVGVEIDLAGFGSVPARFRSGGEFLVVLSEAAEALGWPLPQACRWARLEHLHDLEAQRDLDQDREDQRVGWECLLGLWPLDLGLAIEDPEAAPDAGGKRWTAATEYLVARERLPALILASPWGREFSSNIKEWSGLAALKAFGNSLKDVLAVTEDGQIDNFFDALTRRIHMSDEEALRKAQRGPVIPDEADESD